MNNIKKSFADGKLHDFNISTEETETNYFKKSCGGWIWIAGWCHYVLMKLLSWLCCSMPARAPDTIRLNSHMILWVYLLVNFKANALIFVICCLPAYSWAQWYAGVVRVCHNCHKLSREKWLPSDDHTVVKCPVWTDTGYTFASLPLRPVLFVLGA